MQNVQKHGNANLLIKRFSRRNYLVSDFNHQTIKEFWKKPLVLEIKKIGVIMNKLVYLGSPNFKLIKIEMREILYNLSIKDTVLKTTYDFLILESL